MENGDEAKIVAVPTVGVSIEASNLPVASDALVSLCPLCCDADLSASPTATALLSACQHRSCNTCMVRWIEREEASGRTAPPGCPFCRCPIIDGDICAILGRKFRPTTNADAPNTIQVDDLTRQWMEEHTVPCGGCGYRIEKADGCDLIECLCGYRFCFRCGEAGGTCGCNPGHDFLYTGARVGEYPIRDRSGHVDFRSCIARRQVQQEREDRRDEAEDEEEERWNWTEQSAAVCTENGRWLFSSRTNAACVSMLTQQLGCTHGAANERRQRHQREIHLDNMNASWLFLSRGKEISAMKQLLVGYDVRLKRIQKRDLLRRDAGSSSNLERKLNLAWLFLPNRIGLRMLEGICDILRKHAIRQESQKRGPKSMNKVDFLVASGEWLFRNSTSASAEGNLRRLVKHSMRLDNKKLKLRLHNFVISRWPEGENEEEILQSTLFVFP